MINQFKFKNFKNFLLKAAFWTVVASSTKNVELNSLAVNRLLLVLTENDFTRFSCSKFLDDGFL